MIPVVAWVVVIAALVGLLGAAVYGNPEEAIILALITIIILTIIITMFKIAVVKVHATQEACAETKTLLVHKCVPIWRLEE